MSASEKLRTSAENKRIEKELQAAVERLHPTQLQVERLGNKIRGGNVDPDALSRALAQARAARRAIVAEQCRQVKERAERALTLKVFTISYKFNF